MAYYVMPSLFIDTERLRNINSGLGQVCLRLGTELARQQPGGRSGWKLTYLVPKGSAGIFGPEQSYVEASWMRKLWVPGSYDVAHCLHQDSIYIPRCSRLVLTIYDLNFLERPDYSGGKKARRLAALQRRINRASILTTSSAYTESIIRSHLSIPARLPVRLVGTGVSIREEDVPAAVPAIMRESTAPFFLFVGAIHPRKNVHTLLPLLNAFPDHRLVLAGPDHHAYAGEVREQAQRAGVLERLVMPGPVDDATKTWLFARCRAFLFPSLSEGFGIPALEAMVFGKPVFLSRLTSLPEIGGADAWYLDDFGAEAMTTVVREGLREFDRDPRRAAAMRERAARYRWDQVAGEFWKIYEELAATITPGQG